MPKKKNMSCVLKHNANREKQVIILMIPNGKGRWHNLAVKKLSALLRRITSKHSVMFIVSIAFILLEQNKLEWHEKVCKNKSFCNIIMPSEDTKILEFN